MMQGCAPGVTPLSRISVRTMKLPESHEGDAAQGEALQPGFVLDDRFVIDALIGSGSFSHVYRAHRAAHPAARVAIKVLRQHLAEDADARRAFAEEAQTASQLRSPYSAHVQRQGESNDGRHYLVMEFADGPSLDRLLVEYGPMHPFCVATFSIQILEALQEAHGLGIVHQDIKPANICIVGTEEQAHIKVLDFGIAQRARLANQRDGAVRCTPSYAAPEALRGRPTYSSDLYSLGLTMAEMLEGEPVYEDTGFYTVSARQLSDVMAPLKSRCVHSPLAAIIRRATSKQASQRFEDAAQMRAAIERVLPTIIPTESGTWPTRYCPLGANQPGLDPLESADTAVLRRNSSQRTRGTFLGPTPQRDPIAPARQTTRRTLSRAEPTVSGIALRLLLGSLTLVIMLWVLYHGPLFQGL